MERLRGPQVTPARIAIPEGRATEPAVMRRASPLPVPAREGKRRAREQSLNGLPRGSQRAS
jgi:hypothetical protein